MKRRKARHTKPRTAKRQTKLEVLRERATAQLQKWEQAPQASSTSEPENMVTCAAKGCGVKLAKTRLNQRYCSARCRQTEKIRRALKRSLADDPETREAKLKRRSELSKKRRAADPGKYRAYERKYDAAHPERHKKYYVANAERLREKGRQYYARNHERIRKRVNRRRQERFAADPKKFLADNRKWYAAHREEVNARRRKRRADNPEKERARDRKRYPRRAEKRRANSRKYYLANREAIGKRERERYARMRDAEAKLAEAKAKAAEAERILSQRTPQEMIKAGRLTVAAGLELKGIKKYQISFSLLPEQHVRKSAVTNTKKFFSRNAAEIEQEKRHLRGLPDDIRKATIEAAISYLARQIQAQQN